MNAAQRIALIWLMNDEVELEAELERIRIESQALASNQATSPEFLKLLFQAREEEQESQPEAEWVTPDPNAIEAFLSGF